MSVNGVSIEYLLRVSIASVKLTLNQSCLLSTTHDLIIYMLMISLFHSYFLLSIMWLTVLN